MNQPENSNEQPKSAARVGCSVWLDCAECGTQPDIDQTDAGEWMIECPKCMAEVVITKSKYAAIECWNFKQERKQSNSRDERQPTGE